MTKSELVNAYIRGDLDRRGFIRKLTTIGVSSGAAAFYATSLANPAAAVAAADRNGAGFVARAQPDGDYGVGVIIENIAEVIAQIISLLSRILSRLEELLGGLGSRNNFMSARLQGAEADIMPVVEDIRSQVGDHVGALQAMFPDSTALTGALDESLAQSAGTEDDVLAAMADEYNQVVGVYAALLPNLEDLEQRQTMTEISIVAGRHVGLLNHFAGFNPVPASFELVIDPATLN